MKKLIVFILITTIGYAQEKTFTFKKDGFTDYVVTEVSGTQSEIYSKAINWIKESYKSPDDVILMTMENEKIRFQGFKPNFNCLSYMGTQVCSNANYIIELSVKDGKYKLDPIEFKLSNSSGASYIIDMNDTSAYYNKKGELKKASEKAPKLLEDLFNGMNEELKQYVTGTKKSDW
jgi:hypothetical protein